MPTKCCNLIQETIFDISNKTFRFLNDETNFHDFTEELKEEIELTNIMKDTELLNYRKSYMPEYLSKKFNFYTTAKRELELKAISERALKAIENMDDLPF